ncbi:tannase/feruloyl esterase family alpha/beta hydrolase [Pseudarthrobacter oxydans]|uniref:tannase/feruloyl esterase family alpha/beta hydrolase n=1 Tax=Pseudarthrobacter oxydans TaxID=1671 RepID=UPI0037FDD1D7
MRKTTLATKALIHAFYNKSPQFSYFVGCSDGGREGLQEVQRYPDDYDGVIVGAPVIDEVATNTFYHAWNVWVNTDPFGRAILTADKIPALHQGVLAMRNPCRRAGRHGAGPARLQS